MTTHTALIKRLRVIANAIADGNYSELTMRIPAEPDRDADIVVMRSALALEALEQQVAGLETDKEQQRRRYDDVAVLAAALRAELTGQQMQVAEDARRRVGYEQEADRLTLEALKLRAEVVALTKEHEFACEIGADYRDKWMAAQAREAKLREALERIVKWDSFPATGKYWDDPNGCQPMSYSAAYGSNGERDFMRSVAVTALASPTDNSALMERLKEERECVYVEMFNQGYINKQSLQQLQGA